MKNINVYSTEGIENLFMSLNRYGTEKNADVRTGEIRNGDNRNLIMFTESLNIPELRRNNNVMLCREDSKIAEIVLEAIDEISIESKMSVLTYREDDNSVMKDNQFVFINQTVKIFRILEKNDMYPLFACIRFDDHNDCYNTTIVIDHNDTKKISEIIDMIGK